MSYNLQAIIGRRSTLEQHAGDFGKVRVASLRQGFALVPLVHDLLEQICGFAAAEPRFRATLLEEREPPQPFVEWMELVSDDGPIAYVEGECHAGPCDQASAVWNGGKIVLGPVRYEEGALNDIQSGKNRGRDGAINVALQFIGAERHWSIDEFDAVGLGGRKRWTDDWVEEGGVEDAPDAGLHDAWLNHLRKKGTWAGLAPDQMASLTFRPDAEAIRAARKIMVEGGLDSLDVGPSSQLKLPIEMTLAGINVTERIGETEAVWPVIYLAKAGLEWVRWAACGAESVLTFEPTRRFWLNVRGSVAEFNTRDLRSWIKIPYADLHLAWARFGNELRAYLRRELPELAEHRVCGAWLRNE